METCERAAGCQVEMLGTDKEVPCIVLSQHEAYREDNAGVVSNLLSQWTPGELLTHSGSNGQGCKDGSESAVKAPHSFLMGAHTPCCCKAKAALAHSW